MMDYFKSLTTLQSNALLLGLSTPLVPEFQFASQMIHQFWEMTE
jgi:hypothetical protein